MPDILAFDHPWFVAARKRDAATLGALKSRHCGSTTRYGHTALMYVCEYSGDTECASILSEEISMVDASNTTALYCALRCGKASPKLISLLVQEVHLQNLVHQGKEYPIRSAIYFRCSEEVVDAIISADFKEPKLILEKYGPKFAPSLLRELSKEYSSLFLRYKPAFRAHGCLVVLSDDHTWFSAARSADLQFLQGNRQTYCCAVNSEGLTALMLICDAGCDLECMRACSDEVGFVDHGNRAALHYALHSGKATCDVVGMLASEASIRCTNIETNVCEHAVYSALYYRNREDVVDKLVGIAAAKSEVIPAVFTPVTIGLLRLRYPNVYMRYAGRIPNTLVSVLEEDNPWFKAARKGDAQTLQKLRGGGANSRDPGGMTALMYVCKYNRTVDAAKAISVEIELADNGGHTALQYALRYRASRDLIKIVLPEAHIPSTNFNTGAQTYALEAAMGYMSLYYDQPDEKILRYLISEDLRRPDLLIAKYTPQVIQIMRERHPGLFLRYEGRLFNHLPERVFGKKKPVIRAGDNGMGDYALVCTLYITNVAEDVEFESLEQFFRDSCAKAKHDSAQQANNKCHHAEVTAAMDASRKAKIDGGFAVKCTQENCHIMHDALDGMFINDSPLTLRVEYDAIVISSARKRESVMADRPVPGITLNYSESVGQLSEMSYISTEQYRAGASNSNALHGQLQPAVDARDTIEGLISQKKRLLDGNPLCDIEGDGHAELLRINAELQAIVGSKRHSADPAHQ